MANLDMALSAVKGQIKSALNSAGLTQRGQVIIGMPVATEWAKIAGQDSSGAIVSIYPLGDAKNVTRYDASTPVVVYATPPLRATVTPTTITFSGSCVAGINIHTVLSDPNADAYYQTLQSDTLTSVATAVAAKMQSVSGVTASASANVVTYSGSSGVVCNIGSSGSLMNEVSRVQRSIQVTIWTSSGNDVSNPNLADRSNIGEAILAALGTVTNHWVTASDGSLIFIRYRTDRWSDQASDSYTTFRWDLFYEIEYGVTQTVSATPVGVVEVISVSNNNPPVTVYLGGS